MSTDKAEFAKFFNLLVHLASKENREDLSVPRDLAPLLKKLETALSNEDGEVKFTSTSKSRHSRRKSHAEGDIAKFPLAEEYPFTFKLMIHKLYDMDEWAKKVKEVVEKSQCQYKPLTDELKSSPRSPIAGQHEQHVQIRAIKKRCTGRTRAISGPSFIPEPGWISNATRAINEASSDEGRPRRESPPNPAGPPRSRPRYQSLSPLDTNVCPLKRASPSKEEPRQPTVLKASKPSKYVALSNDALRAGAQNFQAKRRVRSSTFSVAPARPFSNAIVGTKRPIIPN